MAAFSTLQFFDFFTAAKIGGSVKPFRNAKPQDLRRMVFGVPSRLVQVREPRLALWRVSYNSGTLVKLAAG